MVELRKEVKNNFEKFFNRNLRFGKDIIIQGGVMVNWWRLEEMGS